MSGLNLRLGEKLRIKEDGEWVSYRVAQHNAGGVNLVGVDTDKACWKGFRDLRLLYGDRELTRERIAPDGTTDLARRLMGTHLLDRPESEREHVRWLAPYVIAYSKSGIRQHASRSKLETLIERVATEQGHPHKPGWRTLSNHLKGLARGSWDGRDLAPRISARGNRTRRFKAFEEKIEQIIDASVFVKTRLTLDQVHAKINTELAAYNAGAAAGDRARATISVRTIERRIAKRSNEVKTLATGGKQAVRKLCAIVGVAPKPKRPMEYVLIDHTLLDVIVIHPETGQSMGRPCITAAIDLYTRMIVGVAIGFEAPSTTMVLKCLRSAMLPKDRLLEKYGLRPNSWPCMGSIRVLVMDNGKEFHGADLDDCLAQLLIDKQWCAAGTPWEKGPIERWFGRLNHELIHALAGSTFSNPKERGDYDSEKMACHTVADIRRYVVKWIVTDYSVDIHDGIDQAPLVRWAEAVEEHGLDTVPDAADLDILLLSSEPARLYREGIRMFGGYYGGHDRHGRLRAILNDPGRDPDCLVKYDPDDIGWIYLLDRETNCFLPLRRNDFDYADGLTKLEHELAAASARKKARAYETLTLPMLQANRVANRDDIERREAAGKLRGRTTVRQSGADGEHASAKPARARRQPAAPALAPTAAKPAGFAMPHLRRAPDADLGTSIGTII